MCSVGSAASADTMSSQTRCGGVPGGSAHGTPSDFCMHTPAFPASRPPPPPSARAAPRSRALPRSFTRSLRQYREFHDETYFHRDCYARRAATIFLSALQPPPTPGATGVAVAGTDDPEPAKENVEVAGGPEELSEDDSELSRDEGEEEATARRRYQQKMAEYVIKEQRARQLDPSRLARAIVPIVSRGDGWAADLATASVVDRESKADATHQHPRSDLDTLRSKIQELERMTTDLTLQRTQLQEQCRQLEEKVQSERHARLEALEQLESMSAEKESVLRRWHAAQQQVRESAQYLSAEIFEVYVELSETREDLNDLPTTVEQLLSFGNQGLELLHANAKELELAQLQGAHVAKQQEAQIEDLHAFIAQLKTQLQERQEEVEGQRQVLEQDLVQMQEYREIISGLRKEMRAENRKRALFRDATTQVVDRRVEAQVRSLRQSRERIQDEMPKSKQSRRRSSEHRAAVESSGMLPPPDLSLTLKNLEQTAGFIFTSNDCVLVAFGDL